VIKEKGPKLHYGLTALLPISGVARGRKELTRWATQKNEKVCWGKSTGAQKTGSSAVFRGGKEETVSEGGTGVPSRYEEKRGAGDEA